MEQINGVLETELRAIQDAVFILGYRHTFDFCPPHVLLLCDYRDLLNFLTLSVCSTVTDVDGIGVIGIAVMNSVVLEAIENKNLHCPHGW